MSAGLSHDPEVLEAKAVMEKMRDASKGDVDAQRWLAGFWFGYDEMQGGHPILIVNAATYARLAFANTGATADLGLLINLLDRVASRHWAAGDVFNAEVADAEVIALADVATDRPDVVEAMGETFAADVLGNVERALARLSSNGRELSRRFRRVYDDAG